MVPNNDLTDGLSLADNDGLHYIFYAEDVTSIHMDLSAMKRPQPAIAVDALKPYLEIDLEVLQPKSQTWTAPYESDWVIAIGQF